MIQRSPPAGCSERWQPELDALAPRTSFGFAHLRLVWEPGEAWCPVERWMIYEMHPAHRAPLGVFEELKGPSPRLFGRYDAALGRFVRAREFGINMQQWRLYHDTGFWGRPIWVVQGRFGGHKRRWSDVEKNLVRVHTEGCDLDAFEVEPPLPGELDYAEPDLRTIAKLKGLDMVGRYGDLLRYLADDGGRAQAIRDGLDFRERAVAQEMARQVWSWMDEQVTEAFESQMTHAMADRIWDSATDDDDFVMPDYECEQEESIDAIAGNYL